MGRLLAGDHVPVREKRLTLAVVARDTSVTLTTPESVFNDHPGAYLHPVPLGGGIPNLLDSSDNFMSHDDGVWARAPGSLSPIHAGVGSADACHLDL
jgi:hypothetical protein